MARYLVKLYVYVEARDSDEASEMTDELIAVVNEQPHVAETMADDPEPEGE